MAPDFAAVPVMEPQRDIEVKLSDQRGGLVVLMFYPKDDTPGCTAQACAIRDGWEGIYWNALVLGVSVDSVKSHKKFLAKHKLPYMLISDEDRQIVEAYGVWVEKSMYGRSFMGTARTTFVIGPDGRIEAILEKLAPAEHFAKLKAVVDEKWQAYFGKGRPRG